MSINSYRDSMPLMKRFWEEMMFCLLFLRNYMANGFRHKTVLFYPEFPSKRTVLSKILRNARYNITNNPGLKHNIAIYWENKTFRGKKPLPVGNMINAGLTDISKEYLDQVHREVFGYGLSVDPAGYRGQMVEKSNLNAMHDGHIVQGPLEKAEKGCVYQLILNNEVENGLVMDYRCPVIKNEIPFVYLKYRPKHDRFSNTNTFAEVKETGEVFEKTVQENILELCNKLGAEYAELDVLKNNEDSKFYVVDVNPTPWGPPNHLEKGKVQLAKGKLFHCFRRNFLN